MELFQVFWDDQKNLFLEFKKDQNEKSEIVPNKVKRLNLKYEIIPLDKDGLYPNESLISIKKFNFFKDSLLFSINFDDLNYIDNLEINFLLLTIVFYSGKRWDYLIEKNYELSEIVVVEDNINELYKISTKSKFKYENTITQERVIEEVDKDLSNNREKRRYIYEKNKIKNSIESEKIVSLINGGNERLEKVEEELKNIKEILKNLAANNISNLSYDSHCGPPLRMENRSIKKIRVPKSTQPLKPTGTLPYLAELKALINDESTFKTYLKPMNEKEFTKITLSDELLVKKQEELYRRQIILIENQEKKKCCLEDLKKPK